MIVIPGTKNTLQDLLWMRKNGLEAAVKKSKCPIFGICGGYQMMGESITDSINAEGGGSARGMELLPMETVFKSEKTRTRVNGRFGSIGGALAALSGVELEGYEIHMGETRVKGSPMVVFPDGREDGCVNGRACGTYVHGIFDKTAAEVVKCLCEEKGISADKIGNVDASEMMEREYDRLADLVRNGFDMDYIYAIIEGGNGK